MFETMGTVEKTVTAIIVRSIGYGTIKSATLTQQWGTGRASLCLATRRILKLLRNRYPNKQCGRRVRPTRYAAARL